MEVKYGIYKKVRDGIITDDRLSYLDIAKGLGMFFIVFGHVMKSGMIRQVVFSFHVPLFFILSGLTFSYVFQKNGLFGFVQKNFRG